jgi:O-antigen/teichoic acid export membrane protein
MSREPPTHAGERRWILWSSEFARTLLGFTAIALLARLVSPEVLGIYLSITSIALIMPRLLDCGLPHAFGYFLRAETGALRAGVAIMARHVSLTVPLALLIGFAVSFVPFANGDVAAVARHHWIQLALFMVSELAILLGLSTFIPTGRFKEYAATVLVSPLLLLLCIALWSRSDLSAGRLLDLLLGASLTGSIVMSLVLARAARARGGARLSTRAVYSYGIRSYGAAVSKVAAQRFDRLFLVTVLGSAGYAQYSLAVSVRDMAIVPANLYAMTLRNHQIDLIARRADLSAARSMLLRVSAIWLGLGLLGAIALYGFWELLITLVFGPRLQGAANFIRIVAFSCAPLAIMGFAWNHLYAMRLPGRVTWLTSLSLFAAVPTFVMFIQIMGPTVGVAVAVVAWAVAAAIASLACALVSGLPPSSEEMRSA